MKILLISSSPHKEKSRTFALAQEVLKGAVGEGAREEIIHLADCHIEFCQHCEDCHREILHCTISDSIAAVLDAMLSADGIILASPNYINQVTASLKALFDRSAHFIHCKRLLGKYIAGVVSSGSGQDAGVTDYLTYYAHTCGAQYSGSVSSSAYSIQQKFSQAQQLGKALAFDIKENKIDPDQAAIIEAGRQHFKRVIELRKDDWQQEYKYWQAKGWLQ